MPHEADADTMEVLNRIATALERISASLASGLESETPFVFGDMPPRVRRDLSEIGDPGTCQGMLRIGRQRVLEDGRRISASSCERYIDPVMERLGFGAEWMAS